MVRRKYTCPPDANKGDPNSNTLFISKLPKASSDVAVVSACRNVDPTSPIPDNPEACFSASADANKSFTDVCLTFSAMAPIAWAAATLVSQFLLRKYGET
jgi:hypothetical protein